MKRFWHKDCVAGISLAAFSDAYRKWCAKFGYRFSQSDAEKLHTATRNAVATFPKNDSAKLLIAQAVDSLNAVYDSLYILRGEMLRLASLLPEFVVVMEMQGAGKVTGPQLMAEIGDVRRFTHKGALVAFAGMDAPPFQSGYIRLQVPPYLKTRLAPSANYPVHGRQHDPPALRPGQSYISVHKQKAGRGQAHLRLHGGRCGQVPSRLICQGKGSSGGAGQRSKYRRLTENDDDFQPVRKIFR